MLDQNTLNELRKKLEEERGTLTAELLTIATPDPNLKGDWNVKHEEWEEGEVGSEENLETGVAADESEEDQKNKALSDRLELRLRDVNDALQRMDGETYGICETCKKPIPLERLEANPAAKTDIEHAG